MKSMRRYLKTKDDTKAQLITMDKGLVPYFKNSVDSRCGLVPESCVELNSHNNSQRAKFKKTGCYSSLIITNKNVIVYDQDKKNDFIQLELEES